MPGDQPPIVPSATGDATADATVDAAAAANPETAASMFVHHLRFDVENETPPIPTNIQSEIKNVTMKDIKDEAKNIFNRKVDEVKETWDGILKGGKRLIASYSNGIDNAGNTYRKLTDVEKTN